MCLWHPNAVGLYNRQGSENRRTVEISKESQCKMKKSCEQPMSLPLNVICLGVVAFDSTNLLLPRQHVFGSPSLLAVTNEGVREI